MRLRIGLLAVVLMLICSITSFADNTYEPVTDQYDNLGVVQCPKYCNIRQQPSSSSKVVGLIQNNGAVEILSTGDKWYAVRSGGVSGYIMKDYVSTDMQLANSLSTKRVHVLSPTAVYSSKNTTSKVWEKSTAGRTYTVTADDGNWVQIDLDGGTGYIQVNDCIKLCYGLDTANPTYDVSSYSSVRQNIVTYAMQFLGNAYVWGGNDPHTGADCSGFVKYVYKHVADITLPRVSYEQCYSGSKISSLEMKPGDLIFYANAEGTVNHVAMYIGNGTIIHAASRKSGIKLSEWNYRTPKYIRKVLND